MPEAVLASQLKDFLAVGSPQEKASIASQVVRVVARESDAGRVKFDMAEATGAMIGAAGGGAPEVAAAIAGAAGPDHVDAVVVAIAIAASLGENPDAVRAAAIEALPEGSREAAQAIMAMPDSSIDDSFREKVLNAARSFKMIQANWDPVQSKPTRDLFMDSDGGEPPCRR